MGIGSRTRSLPCTCAYFHCLSTMRITQTLLKDGDTSLSSLNSGNGKRSRKTGGVSKGGHLGLAAMLLGVFVLNRDRGSRLEL